MYSEKITFDFKDIIASVTDTVFTENQNALKFLLEFSVKSGVDYSEEYAVIPEGSTVIPNVNGAMQGYMLEDQDFSLVVLPEFVKQFKPMCEKYVVPYFDTKYGKKPYRLCLKYFGDVNTLNKVLQQAKANSTYDFEYSVVTKNGDTCVSLMFPSDCSRTESATAVRYIVGELKDGIYAEFDTSLSERLYDLLKLKNKKISVAESFTGGRIVSELIKNSGVSHYLDEGLVTYSNESKNRRLKVKAEDLIKHGAVSSQVAYQMALGLLTGNSADIAIATTGIAGPKSDDTLKPVGLCYIAIGMKDGIHVYKYNLKGDREEITETAKNTALFLAIKKLKNI
jgi:nicotinamide-nucleotide amidase